MHYQVNVEGFPVQVPAKAGELDYELQSDPPRCLDARSVELAAQPWQQWAGL